MELIITEKPKAAERIANALADGKVSKGKIGKAPHYKFKKGKKDVVVGCTVGHIYGLAEKNKGKWTYPVFDVEWKPIYEIDKSASFVRTYVTALKRLAKDADTFTIACDYDIEGEVIGLNVLRFICKQKDARRMKFSTLTKPDLTKAYDNASPHIDWGQAKAGETRHELDWYYGINLSRALTSAIKSAGMFKILSSGRVQGPALKIIVDKEKDILKFKPKPYWQIELKGKVKKGLISAWHEKDKFWERPEAKAIVDKVKGKHGFIKSVEKRRTEQSPPYPFDLTTLQTEAYRCFGITPKKTLDIAQELYTSGLISYPRTSSQKLPRAIGHSKIINNLSKQKHYSSLCKKLLAKKTIVPREGSKTDPAHPAIFPTGLVPKGLGKRGQSIYDLIVKRFLACFAQPAVKENVVVKISVSHEIFVAKGSVTIDKGWYAFYAPYVKSKDEELPETREKENVSVKKVVLHKKQTQPPKRFTQASIVRELEKRNLGTKATRASIVDTLFKRGYITGKAIEATKLGFAAVKTLGKYSPKMLDERLTRHFEVEMEQVRENKKKPQDVLEEAKELLKNMLKEFKNKEEKIGKGLMEATIETRKRESLVGICPVCEEGELNIRRGKFGRFIACSKYPDCKTTFSIPNTGMVKTSEEKCKECHHPLIKMIRRAKKPQKVCINPECPSKKVEEKIKKRNCPKCKKGKLVLRKSVYGSFLACDKYPKCRYTESINNNKKIKRRK
jgi:DNA topoisomerase-1